MDSCVLRYIHYYELRGSRREGLSIKRCKNYVFVYSVLTLHS